MKNLDLTAIASASLAAPLSIQLPAGDLPDTLDFQFMPPGQHPITPFVTTTEGTQAEDLIVTVSAKYAEIFQRAHERLLAQANASQGDTPYTDFNHDDDKASSHPQRYYWGGEDPKTGGVRCVTGLSGSGKTGLINRDYTRFSPQWIFNRKTGEPLGLPVNQGALVNRSAFKTIAPMVISAADAGKQNWALGVDGAALAAAADATCPTCGKGPCECADDDGGKPDALGQAAHKASSKAAMAEGVNAFNAHSDAFQAHTKAAAAHKAAGNEAEAEIHTQMADFHKKKAKEIAKETLTASAGDAAANQNKNTEPMTPEEIGVISAKAAEAAAKALEPVITGLRTEITTLKNQGVETARASARSAVMVHVARGAIAPEAKLPSGKLAVDHWTDAYLASASDAEALLGSLPGKTPGRRIILSPASGGASAAALAAHAPEEVIMVSAKEARKASPEKFKSDADAIEAYMRTAEGIEHYDAFRSDIRTGAARSRLAHTVVK